MQQKQLLGLIGLSFLITNIVAYLDEGIRTFDYLTAPGDWVALIIYTLLFLVLPVILFLGFKKSKQRFLITILGFMPTLLLIIPNL